MQNKLSQKVMLGLTTLMLGGAMLTAPAFAAEACAGTAAASSPAATVTSSASAQQNQTGVTGQQNQSGATGQQNCASSKSASNMTFNDLKSGINNLPNGSNRTSLSNILNTYESKLTMTEKAKAALLAALNDYSITVKYTAAGEIDLTDLKIQIKNLDDPAAITKLNKLVNSYEMALNTEKAVRSSLNTQFDKVIMK